MRSKTISVFLFLIASQAYSLAIDDPVVDFKNRFTIDAGDKILRIDSDINGDQKLDSLLAIKSEYQRDMDDYEPPGWIFYIANSASSGYWLPDGTEHEPNHIAVGDIPLIDIERCYVGQIDEINARGIITMRIDNPRVGPAIGKIYAYTIEGDHLKLHQLAEYNFEADEHPLYLKYLTNEKRTQVELQEIAP